MTPVCTVFCKEGKKWTVPEVLPVDGKSVPHFFEILDFRKPKKGEYYISGAVPALWKARHDMSTEFLVAKLTHTAQYQRLFVRGDPV